MGNQVKGGRGQRDGAREKNAYPPHDSAEDTASYIPATQEKVERDYTDINPNWEEEWELEQEGLRKAKELRQNGGKRDRRTPDGEEYQPYNADDYEDYGEYDEYDETGDGDSKNVAPRKNTMVLCSQCGEEYSVTYRRCPFCDERPDGQAKGRSGGAMDPRHMVGLCISIALIFSAGFIIFSQVKPLLMPQGEGTVTGSDSTGERNPSSYTPDSGDVDPTGGAVRDEGVETPDATDTGGDTTEDDGVGSGDTQGDTQQELEDLVEQQPEPSLDLEPEATGGTITLANTDVTLKGDESFTLRVTAGGSVNWESSHPEYATVNSSGVVTNLNSSGATKIVEITASRDGMTSAVCVVRCGTGTGAAPDSGSTESGSTDSETTTTPSTGATVGTSGVIVGATGGLRVRSGAGTTYDVQDTLLNGSEISVVADGGNGWYQISYTGAGGSKITGYILGEYIGTSAG